MNALRIAFVGQLALMLPAWVAFVTQPAGLGTLYLIVYAVALGLAVGAFAIWQAWRFPGARWLAFASILTTLICVSTPFVINAFKLPALPLSAILAAALVLTVFVAGTLLANRKRWQPGKLFLSQNFNKGMLITIIIALALIWVPIVVWLASGQGAELGASQSKDNATRSAFLIYYSSVSLPAVIVMSFSMLFSFVALIRSPGSRLVHAGQLAASLILLISLGIVAGGLGIAMLNPG